MWYTDCPAVYGSVIKLAMEGRVGVGLHPDDDGIKQDLYHLIERFRDTLMPGHSLTDTALNQLWGVFRVYDKSDEDRWLLARGDEKYPKKSKWVRAYCPPPEDILPRLASWVEL